jgi:hypothetical protein
MTNHPNRSAISRMTHAEALSAAQQMPKDRPEMQPTILVDIDPIVILRYDNQYALTRASRSDEFRPIKGRDAFYTTVAKALAGCQYVALDLGHVSSRHIRAAGCVPVRWHNASTHAGTGWVEA